MEKARVLENLLLPGAKAGGPKRCSGAPLDPTGDAVLGLPSARDRLGKMFIGTAAEAGSSGAIISVRGFGSRGSTGPLSAVLSGRCSGSAAACQRYQPAKNAPISMLTRTAQKNGKAGAKTPLHRKKKAHGNPFNSRAAQPARAKSRRKLFAYRAARRGMIRQLLPELTHAQLAEKTKSGKTILHVLKERGELCQVGQLLTIELLAKQDWLEIFPVVWFSPLKNEALPDIRDPFTERNIALRDRHGNALVHYLPYAGALPLVKHLLNPRLLRLKDGSGNTVMHLAATHQNFYAITDLVSANLLQEKDADGWSVAHRLAEHEELHHIKDLLMPKLLNQRDNEGFTVAHVAIINRQVDVIAKHLSRKMLLKKTREGSRGTHFCASWGSLHKVAHLLTAPDVVEEDGDGDTPIGLFLENEKEEAERQVLGRGNTWHEFKGDIEQGKQRAVELWQAAVTAKAKAFPEDVAAMILAHLMAS